MVHSRRGFTLIELLSVIVILSLFSAGALAMVRLPLRKARHSTFLSQLKVLESNARQHAMRGTPCDLTFDTASRTARVLDHHGGELAGPIAWPPTLQLKEVLMQESGFGDSGPVKSATRVPYFEGGVSPSFAIRWEVGDVSDYALVLGLSGEWIRIDNSKGNADEYIRTLLSQ